MEQSYLLGPPVEREAPAASKWARPVNSALYINQTSGDVEYYTPEQIFAAARRVMGGIDLDPASSAQANRIVQAKAFYTRQEDGLQQPWCGNVWMNHSFGREENPRWINKLCAEYATGRVRQACCITFAATSEAWLQPLFKHPMCFLTPRTNYFLPDGCKKSGVTKGSVVTYLGRNVAGFVQEFHRLGPVMLPAGQASEEALLHGHQWNGTPT